MQQYSQLGKAYSVRHKVLDFLSYMLLKWKYYGTFAYIRVDTATNHFLISADTYYDGMLFDYE